MTTSETGNLVPDALYGIGRVAKELQCSTDTVRRTAAKAGIEPVLTGGGRKFTGEQIKQLIYFRTDYRRYADRPKGTLMVPEIAKELGVHADTVRKAIARLENREGAKVLQIATVMDASGCEREVGFVDAGDVRQIEYMLRSPRPKTVRELKLESRKKAAAKKEAARREAERRKTARKAGAKIKRKKKKKGRLEADHWIPESSTALSRDDTLNLLQRLIRCNVAYHRSDPRTVDPTILDKLHRVMRKVNAEAFKALSGCDATTEEKNHLDLKDLADRRKTRKSDEPGEELFA